MNRASLDRGFGRCIVLRKYGTSLKKYANRTQVRPTKGTSGRGAAHGAALSCVAVLGCRLAQVLWAARWLDGMEKQQSSSIHISYFMYYFILHTSFIHALAVGDPILKLNGLAAAAAPQDRIVLPAVAASPNPAQRPAKFRLLDRDGIAAAGEVLTQGRAALCLPPSCGRGWGVESRALHWPQPCWVLVGRICLWLFPLGAKLLP